MKSLFLSSFRSGLIALGLVAGLSAPSLAAPIPKPLLPANGAGSDVVQVRDDWAGGNDRQIWRWRNQGFQKWEGGKDWKGGKDWRWRSDNFRGRHFARSDKWNHSNKWNNGGWGDDWRWRHHRHHRRDFNDSALFLGLGLGLPAYDEYYGGPTYYEPSYPPRRYYRTQRLSSAHVEWCYNRYRSYRARDNSFKPNYGPRQQCFSPFS